MQFTLQLRQQLAQAVRTSMRIEGYQARALPQTQAKALALMEQQRVQVSARQMSKIKTRLFDAANYLNDAEDIAAYLQVVMEDADPALLAAALGSIARARGMTQLAKDTHSKQALPTGPA